MIERHHKQPEPKPELIPNAEARALMESLKARGLVTFQKEMTYAEMENMRKNTSKKRRVL